MNLKKMGIKIWITRHSTTYNCNDEDSVAIIFNCNGVVAQIPNKLAECVTRDVYINKKTICCIKTKEDKRTRVRNERKTYICTHC